MRVIVASLLFEFTLAWVLGAFDWKLDLTDLPLLRLSGVMAIGLGAWWFLLSIAHHFIDQALTSWWEPGPAPEPDSLTWDEVYGLVAFDCSSDPLGLAATARWPWWKRSLIRQVPLYFSIGGLALSALDLMRDPTPRISLLQGTSPALSKEMVATTGNPSAYLALVVGAATIFFTFRQIRAKVRADSRQQWIIHARKLLGEVVALIDLHRDLQGSNKFKQALETWEKLNPIRLELELMLNPSEKDHRLLLYLIQRFAMWRTPRQESQDAQIVRRSISGLADGRAGPYKIPDKWKPIIDGRDRAELVSYILRLSHVVLKREWERVKHTR